MRKAPWFTPGHAHLPTTHSIIEMALARFKIEHSYDTDSHIAYNARTRTETRKLITQEKVHFFPLEGGKELGFGQTDLRSGRCIAELPAELLGAGVHGSARARAGATSPTRSISLC